MTNIEEVAASVIEDFDLVVLGSGEGSKFLAWTLARQGKRVAVHATWTCAEADFD